jgi:hypothetical protein
MGCWSLEKSYPIFGDLKKTKKNRSIQLPLCDVFLLLSLNLPLWGLIQKLIFVWIETWPMPPRYEPFPELSAKICRLVLLSSIEFLMIMSMMGHHPIPWNLIVEQSRFCRRTASLSSLTTKHHNSNRLGRFCRPV